MLTDGLEGTLAVELGHQTLVISHLCKQFTGFLILSRLIEGTGIDVLHHVLIDGLNKLAGSLLPVVDILLVASQHHVTAHIEQCML